MDYKYIRAWGQSLRSRPYYIENEVAKARQAKAPQTAIYRRQDGSWAVFDDIQRADTKSQIAILVAGIK